MTTRDKLIKALKYDERIWRAFELLKPIHRDGLLDALESAAVRPVKDGTAAHSVRVSNGKYTFAVSDFRTIAILRGGMPWHEQREAFSALHSIICELDAARVVLAAARSLDKRDAAPPELRSALNLHAALVGDQEHPSEWAVPSC